MRTLTIVLHFDQDRVPDWIWDAHKHNAYVNGVLISVIADGDKLSAKGEDNDNF